MEAVAAALGRAGDRGDRSHGAAGARDGARCIGRRRRRRLRRRRRRQRGAERDRRRRPVGAIPGGGTSVFARALGLPRDPAAAAERVADAIVGGTDAADLARPRRRPPLRLRGRRRLRRRDRAACRCARPRAATESAPATSPSRTSSSACSARERFRLEPALEVERARPRRCGVRGELRSVHLRRRDPAARRARGALRARARPRRSRTVAARDAAALRALRS